ERADDGAEKGGRLVVAVAQGFGVRLHVNDAAVHLAVGGPVLQGANGGIERLVVEHAAVDERNGGGVAPVQRPRGEQLLDEGGAVAPHLPALGHDGVDRADGGGRKRAGERGGGAGGEGEAGNFPQLATAAGVGAGVVEGDNQPVLALVDARGRVEAQRLVVAVVVRH